MKIIPSPGVALVLPLDDKPTSFVSGNKKEQRIVKGRIIKMGANDLNNYGGVLEAKNYGKDSDLIYFLSYYAEGGYDQIKIDNVLHYFVKFGDFRGTIIDD